MRCSLLNGSERRHPHYGGSCTFAELAILQPLLQDLTDRDHDLKTDPKEDKKYKDCLTTCQASAARDWNGRCSATICRSCTKRDGPNPVTIRLQELHAMIRGGMPIRHDELPAEVWKALGLLTARERIF